MSEEARDDLSDEFVPSAFLPAYRGVALGSEYQDKPPSEGTETSEEEPQLQDGLPGLGRDSHPL